MSSSESTNLTVDFTPLEEKIILSPPAEAKCFPITFMIIWTILAVLMFIFVLCSFGPLCIFPGIFVVIGIVRLYLFEKGTEVKINNSNRNLILQKKNICNCLINKPRIIDLNQVEKIRIINLINFRNSGLINNYSIIYKNGTIENLSNYFAGCDEQSLVNCQNLFRKYLTVENTMPQMMVNYPQKIPVYNPNMFPNQQNGFYTDMVQEIPENYYVNANIYSNNNVNDINQNNLIQQNLSIDDGISKPIIVENYGAPKAPQ